MAKLKIYTDENVDVRISEGLKKRGIISFSAIKKGMSGSPDHQHFEYAARLKAIIFTHDHHFIEIARRLTREGKDHWGSSSWNAEEMKNQIEFL